MESLLTISNRIDWILERIARAAGWLFVVLTVVICWDIVTRKFGFQIANFGSTPIQELEWHLHGVLFLFWLGYAYVRNIHVRIDIFTGHLDMRKQARLELFGLIVFAIPYCLVATWYAYGFAETSFLQHESSDAPNGLSRRWIIKSCLVVGLLLLDAAVASVLFRKLVILFGPPTLVERAVSSASTGR